MGALGFRICQRLWEFGSGGGVGEGGYMGWGCLGGCRENGRHCNTREGRGCLFISHPFRIEFEFPNPRSYFLILGLVLHIYSVTTSLIQVGL